MTSQDYYNSRITSDIMYNETRHLVSVFKDYLIYDDFSEYLKRSYRSNEAHERLPRIWDFYIRYSKVFPNYVAMPQEARFMFKNIERKQKVIDQRNRRRQEQQEAVRKTRGRAKAEVEELFSSGFHRDLTQYQEYSKSLWPPAMDDDQGGEPRVSFDSEPSVDVVSGPITAGVYQQQQDLGALIANIS